MRRSLVLAFLMLASCGYISPSRETFDPPGETSGYFPPALFQQSDGCSSIFSGRSPRPIFDEFQDSWYSKHLRAAGERPLSFAAGSPEALRFTWLRSFHAPVIIRVEWAPTGAATLTATMLSGAGGYDPGEISGRVSRTLNQEEIERLGFLRQAALRRQRTDCRMMLDGAQWIVESAGVDGYHFVDAQSPERGAVRELGLALMGFTGWALEPIY